jgi:hypothetical protein
MGISGLFSSFANNLLNHYQQLIDDVKSHRTPQHYFKSTPEILPGQVSDTNVPLTEDSYDSPINQTNPNDLKDVLLAPSDETADDVAIKDVPVNSDTFVPSGEEPENSEEAANNIMPDGTYNFKSSSKLDYKLDLSFDLAAISRTVRYLSEGDVTQVEQLSAAGFGLSADFALKGHQVTKTNFENTEDSNRMTDHLRGRNFSRSNQAGAFMANSRDFKVQSFYKEASRIKSSFDVKNHHGHSRAVNKLAMRYSMDSSFSFANLDRFNVQTQQVADQAPEALSAYFDNSGNLSEAGSNELMATFFNAVDGYLDQAESNLLDKTVAFFEQAATELGFSEPMIAMAKDHLVSTIEGFFDRVDAAINSMESKFVPDQIVTEPEVADIPVVDSDNPDAGKAESTESMAMA